MRWHGTPGAKKNVLGWDIAPFGMYKLLKFVQRRYAPAGGIVITENGMPAHEETPEQARRDVGRTCYIKQYLQQTARAMQVRPKFGRVGGTHRGAGGGRCKRAVGWGRGAVHGSDGGCAGGAVRRCTEAVG